MKNKTLTVLNEDIDDSKDDISFDKLIVLKKEYSQASFSSNGIFIVYIFDFAVKFIRAY